MKEPPSNVQLVGETVTVSYVADPFIGHGQYRLENHEAYTVTASIDSVWLELGEQRQRLPDVSVFDLDRDLPVDPEILVEAGSTLRFLVGFARVAYEPPFGGSTAVGLRANVGGRYLQAVSPITFIRRIPGDR